MQLLVTERVRGLGYSFGLRGRSFALVFCYEQITDTSPMTRTAAPASRISRAAAPAKLLTYNAVADLIHQASYFP